MNFSLYLLQFLLTLSWILGYLGHRWWIFDLFSHFKIQYVFGSLMIFGVSFYCHMFLLCSISFFFLLGVLIASRLIPNEREQKGGDISLEAPPTMTFMSFNVWKQNENYAATVDHIRKTSPDVVGLYETNEAWNKAFRSLYDLYPHQIFYPGKGRFGMSILSKYPFEELDVPQNKGARQRIIVGKVPVPSSSKHLYIYAFHPYSPEGRQNALARNRQLHEMERWVDENKEHPLIIMGDFNASPWSYPLKSIVEKHKLMATKPHKCGTWPSLLGEFGIPIDHILTKNVTANQNGHIGPHLGSDHRPVHAKIHL